MVRFLDGRELRDTPSTMWEALDAGDDVALVADGEPRALVLRIEDGDVEATLRLVRRVRTERAIARMRAAAAERGLDQMDDEAIRAEIAAVRAGRQAHR